MKVILAQPRGFCAGVVRAIEIVERALQKYGPPVYVRHEIVHNKHVVESLKAKGARFVEDLSEVPPDAVTIFSAHGVAQERRGRGRGAQAAGAQRDLSAGHQGAQPGQALCRPGPHADPDRPCRPSRGRGHDGPDLRPGDPGAERGRRRQRSTCRADTPVAYVTQTTLSVDDTQGIIAALQRRFSDIVGPETRDICYATQNRQTAVRELSKLVDVILVVGAKNSSNSNRLREIGSEAGVPSYLIADGSELDPEWLEGAETVGITAGASAPEVLVDDVIDGAAAARAGRGFDAAGPRGDASSSGCRPNWRQCHSTAVSDSRHRGRHTKRVTMHGDSVSQGNAHRRLSAQAEAAGRKRYPLVLMLEPLFRCNLACVGCGKIDYPDAILNQRLSVAGMPRRGRRVRRADGGDPRRRAADPQGDRRDRQGHRRAQEVRLAVHQRAAARKEAASVRAVALSVLLGPSRRPEGASRQVGVPGRRVRARGRRRSRPRKAKGFTVNVNATIFDGHAAEDIAAFLDFCQGARRRRHDLARLRLRARARPGALPQPPQDQGAVPRRVRARQGQEAGSSSSPACSSTSSPATRPTTARRGACRRATSSAGRGPAICSAKATPRPSRS